MATIGTLVAKLNMDSRGFNRGAQKSQSVMSKLGKSALNVGKAVGVMGVAFGTAAVVVMAAMVRQSFKAIDLLAKTADKLGITTEKLAGLEHAATLTGVSASTMDTALQRMVRRLSEAEGGTGVAVKAIAELGLSMDTLSKMTPDEQFSTIADAMNGMKRQSDKVRLAFALFDTEGVNLVNTLALGSDGLREAQAEAERLGIALSRSDAAKIEEANDAMNKFGVAIKGVAAVIAVELAPHITGLVDFVASFASAASTLFRNWGDFAEGIMLSIPIAAIGAMESLAGIVGGFVSAATGLFDAFFARTKKGFLDLALTAASPLSMVIGSKKKPDDLVGDLTKSFGEGQAKTSAAFQKGLIGEFGKKLEQQRNAITERVSQRDFDRQQAAPSPVKRSILPDNQAIFEKLQLDKEKEEEAEEDKIASKAGGVSGDTAAKRRGSAEAFAAILRGKKGKEDEIAANTKAATKIAGDHLDLMKGFIEQEPLTLQVVSIA